jgi:predicted nucleic acid-binding protein
MFTFLSNGSDNYFSSDKEVSGMDRADRHADGCLAGTVHPVAPGAGANERSDFKKVHAIGRYCTERGAESVSAQRIRQKSELATGRIRPIGGPDWQSPSRPTLNYVTGIADTGFLVAFANARDVHHGWAMYVAEQITEPLLTCEAVLAETAFHLRSSELVLEMIAEDLVALAFNCNDHLPQLAALAKRFRNREPDLADLCLIRMSELYPNLRVITTDERDFRVYRRNKREVIPLICPPKR